MENYLETAKNFLEKTNTTFTIEFVKSGKHFSDDTDVRDIYKFTLKRGSRTYSSEFGNSIKNSGLKIKNKGGQHLRTYNTSDMLKDGILKIVENKFIVDGAKFNWSNKQGYKVTQNELSLPTFPDEYDILACLTKYDPDTFENFCGEFGLNTDSKKAEKTYNEVCKEYAGVCSLWNEDEIDQLVEIN